MLSNTAFPQVGLSLVDLKSTSTRENQKQLTFQQFTISLHLE